MIHSFKDCKILITGTNGLLGGAFMFLSKEYEASFADCNIDICDQDATLKTVTKINPDIIIHCAAKTDVEWCESHQDEAEKVNVQGTNNLLRAAKKSASKFVLISSTGVYGDHKTKPYSEEDNTKPASWHHKTKLLAELQVQSYSIPHLIIRTGWLFGSFNNKSDFVLDRLRDAERVEILSSNITQRGNPTYTKNLVEQIMLLIKEDKIGTYNCVNQARQVSRYEYVKKILTSAGVNREIQPVDGQFFKRVAPVSKNEMALNNKLLSQGLNIMPSWDTGLENYIKDRIVL